jgi:hypothetical protein
MEGIIQAISGMLQKVGTMAGGPGTVGAGLGDLGKIGATAGGAGFDLFSNLKNMQMMNLASNPTKSANWIARATAPLTQSQIQGTTQAVQGALGERGLAESPAAMTQGITTGLAPYQQQNQEMATQRFLAMVGEKYPQVDMGSLMKLWKPTPPWTPPGTPSPSIGDPFPSTPPFLDYGTPPTLDQDYMDSPTTGTGVSS